jgi:hypothetical protein
MKKVYTLTNLHEILGKRVKVYFNLHKKTWSIKDKKTGLVIGYASWIPLKDCDLKVSEKGRQRVLREKRKNVHAYVEGTVSFDVADKSEITHGKFTYNPYKYDSFVRFINNEPVKLLQADYVTLRCINKKPSQTFCKKIAI